MIEHAALMVLLTVAVFFIVATVLPLLHYDHWTIRFFDFPRVQITVGAAGTLGGLVAVGPSSLGAYAIIVALGACLVYQIDHVLLYTPLAPKQVRVAGTPDEDHQISLLVCNVERHNRDAESVRTLVEAVRPDLFLALETDDWWIDQLRRLDDQFADAVEYPRDDEYGLALYSRRSLVESEVRFLVEDDVPSVHAQVPLPSGRRVFVYGLHPRPPHPIRKPDTTERDAELLHLTRRLRDRDDPTIVCGDLNDVSWSYTTRLFQNISGLLDPRIGRGPYNTFHARYPLLRYPLDHVFHSVHFRLVELKVLSYVGSDHYPVYAELQYDPDAPEEVHAEPTADDVEEAQAQHELEKLRQKQRG